MSAYTDVMDKLASGQPVDLYGEEYAPAITVLLRNDDLCTDLSNTHLSDSRFRELLNELFECELDESVNFTPPFHIDFGRAMHFGDNVFVNSGFTGTTPGGIYLDDGVELAPNVTIATVNHDFHQKNIVTCKPVHIKKNAWIGSNVCIMPGVTIGENSIVGAGAIVTKDVPDNSVAVGNPAHVIRTID